MLPALTTSGRRLVTRRVLMGSASGLLAAAAVVTQLSSVSVPSSSAAASLADELRPSSWALEIPFAWLAAPIINVKRGDTLDFLAVRTGDRAYAMPIAYAAVVMRADDRSMLLDLDVDDAIAIANARGAGLLLVPLLRSTR